MSKIAAISVSQLISLTEKMQRASPSRPAGVQYYLGAKSDWGDYQIKDGLKGDSSTIRKIDCSGFVRYAAAKCSAEECILPDGSVQIHEFCAAENLPRVLYSTVANDTKRLFIAFMAPQGKEAGHVWLVQGGMTLESHGGRGVDRRPWDTPVLRQNVCACYVFPSVP